MVERYLKGLEGNEKMDNPLVSFDAKDKMGALKAEQEANR